MVRSIYIYEPIPSLAQVPSVTQGRSFLSELSSFSPSYGRSMRYASNARPMARKAVYPWKAPRATVFQCGKRLGTENIWHGTAEPLRRSSCLVCKHLATARIDLVASQNASARAMGDEANGWPMAAMAASMP